jgi:crossover junction endodeoxyribonuclease RuvC
MRILGIDPGSRKTGYAIIELKSKKIEYCESGVLKFDGNISFLERLNQINFQLKELLEQKSVDEVALESLIYVKSPTALIKLAQVRGLILSHILNKHQNRIFEYSPNLIKSSTVGHGHADKESVQKFLHMVFGVIEFQTDDESDALAIALCHALNRDNQVRKLNNGRLKSRGSRGLAKDLSHKL